MEMDNIMGKAEMEKNQENKKTQTNNNNQEHKKADGEKWR